MDHIPLITKKLGQSAAKMLLLVNVGWAVFRAACAVALVYGLVMRGAPFTV